MSTRMLIVASALMLFLGSCTAPPAAPTPDVAVIQTSAAQTVVANFTLTAGAFTPTSFAPTQGLPTATLPASSPSETPTLLPGGVTATPILCDALIYDAATIDVNVPDNTEMQIGQEFVKTWRVRNNGSCSWGPGYKLIFSSGDKLSGVPQPFTAVVAPGQEVEVSVNFKAPTQPGVYVSSWQLANANGIPFPRTFYVKIVVK